METQGLEGPSDTEDLQAWEWKELAHQYHAAHSWSMDAGQPYTSSARVIVS